MTPKKLSILLVLAGLAFIAGLISAAGRVPVFTLGYLAMLYLLTAYFCLDGYRNRRAAAPSALAFVVGGLTMKLDVHTWGYALLAMGVLELALIDRRPVGTQPEGS